MVSVCSQDKKAITLGFVRKFHFRLYDMKAMNLG